VNSRPAAAQHLCDLARLRRTAMDITIHAGVTMTGTSTEGIKTVLLLHDR
jgi:hypothetical protein